MPCSGTESTISHVYEKRRAIPFGDWVRFCYRSLPLYECVNAASRSEIICYMTSGRRRSCNHVVPCNRPVECRP